MQSNAGHQSQIDAALRHWQQGDAILGHGLPFLHIADLNKPVTPAARAEAELGTSEDLTSIAVEVPGFVVVSQTCDVLKPCSDWPYVQLAALQPTDENLLREVQKGLRPRFAWVPAVGELGLVANLNSLVTVEKGVLAGVPERSHVRGIKNDFEARAFAKSLYRKFSRFAFPDDFVSAVRPIQEQIRGKHGRASKEGRAYEELREIRIVAIPGWEAPQLEVEFLFVRNEAGSASGELGEAVEKLMAKFVPTGQFENPRHRIVSLAEMSAALYVASVPLDLDYLSNSALKPPP